ncbi:YhgE/Pip family protein [Terrilactibacillus sp. S3-3]|nr:YhgE/Pip family protein [Terrilactibacillus sp. S3-3]
MTVFQLFWSEVKDIVTKPQKIIYMVAVMTIPLLYAGMFLYAFWDAYGRTGHLPVAIVNQDTGAALSGKQLNAGNSLVKELKKNDQFDWKFVSEKKAQTTKASSKTATIW